MRFDLPVSSRAVWEPAWSWARERVQGVSWRDRLRRYGPAVEAIERLAKQQRVQLTVAGIAIFLLGVWWGGRGLLLPRGVSRSIEISAATVDQLREQWRHKHGRPATAAELKQLIDQRVREEVLSREALLAGLSLDDDVVRRRLTEQADATVLGKITISIPDESTLRRYFSEHPELYVQPARVSFQHVYFDPIRRGHAAVADARTSLKSLSTQSGDVSISSDPFSGGTEFNFRTESEIAEIFGSHFAGIVISLPEGWWTGPISSPHGLHLVNVVKRIEARQVQFEEVRDGVLRAYLNAQRQEQNFHVMERLKRKYRIQIDPVAEQ